MRHCDVAHCTHRLDQRASAPDDRSSSCKKIEDFFDQKYWEDWHEHLADHALPELRTRDNDHAEVGASPFLTEKGWLLIYSYIQDYYDEHERLFSIEAALLDAKKPQKLISRTESILVPQEFYEEYGLVPHIVFPTSTTIDGDHLESGMARRTPSARRRA